jgi:hypothetical protein
MSRIAKRQDRQDGFSILSILPLCDPAHPVLSSEILKLSEKIKLIHYIPPDLNRNTRTSAT